MARIGLISDIHGNLSALEAILSVLDKEEPDYWLCMGDIVGYGPEPKECLDLIIDRNMLSVLGNHDAGVIGKVSLNHFRNPNRKLIELTRTLITKEQMEWLNQLPLTLKNEKDSWFAVHASPNSPEKWEYLESAFVVREILKEMEYNFCFVGHTHKPVLVSDIIGINRLQNGNKFLINPGSVGQPRDSIQKASCGLIDTVNYEYKNIRINYDTESVLYKLESLGFTREEAERLMLPR